MGGDCSAAGEGGGEQSAPSTCSIATLSAGDNASLFFLALVILGDVTGLLQLVFEVAVAAGWRQLLMLPLLQAVAVTLSRIFLLYTKYMF